MGIPELATDCPCSNSQVAPDAEPTAVNPTSSLASKNTLANSSSLAADDTNPGTKSTLLGASLNEQSPASNNGSALLDGLSTPNPENPTTTVLDATTPGPSSTSSGETANTLPHHDPDSSTPISRHPTEQQVYF